MVADRPTHINFLAEHALGSTPEGSGLSANLYTGTFCCPNWRIEREQIFLAADGQ